MKLDGFDRPTIYLLHSDGNPAVEISLNAQGEPWLSMSSGRKGGLSARDDGITVWNSASTDTRMGVLDDGSSGFGIVRQFALRAGLTMQEDGGPELSLREGDAEEGLRLSQNEAGCGTIELNPQELEVCESE